MAASASGMDRKIAPSRLSLGGRVALAVIGVAGAVFVAIEVFINSGVQTLRMPAALATIATVEQGIFHDLIPLRASVVPRETLYVDAVDGGRVDRVLVEPGDTVQQGQPIVELSNTNLALSVIQQESQLNQAISQLQQNEIALEQNKLANERALAEVEYGLVRMKRSGDRRDNLDVVHRTLDGLIVRAPVSGRVTAIDLKVGEHKDAGQRLAEVTPPSGMKLSADVDEFYLARVHMGQVANIELHGRPVNVTVQRIYPQVREGRFRVDFDFDGASPGELVAGETAQGRLQLGDDSSARIVPVGPFLERTGGDWIFVISSDGKSAQRRHIEVGRRSVEQLEILSGLAVGERVMISDYAALEKADRVLLTH